MYGQGGNSFLDAGLRLVMVTDDPFDAILAVDVLPMTGTTKRSRFIMVRVLLITVGFLLSETSRILG